MKILIATPAYGGLVYSSYTESLIYTCFMLKMMNIDFELKFINNQIVTRARNMCASIFMEDKSFTHLLFIDADVIWNPLDVQKLILHKKECIIGIYPNKKSYWKNNDLTLNPSSVLESSNIQEYSKLLRVKYAATGFMLIERKGLERIKEKVETFELPDSNGNQIEVKNYFDCKVVGKEYLTEDYYFSYLLNQNGGEIFADSTIMLRHIGFHEYGELLR